ncbi:glycosyltransferase family 2 protein [Paenibacillus sp. FSL K6-1230]
MKHQTISLCMIVKNEERTLERCLNSIQGIVDEIIIVDTGSTDRTLEIAQQFNAKIYNFEWTSNFSDARNYAIQYATGDYILSLDADEYLDENSKKLLLEPLNAAYYFLRIRNLIRAGIVDTHSFIRLFSRGVGYIYKGAIHEQINILDFPEAKGDGIPVYINHDGYNKVIIESKDKNDRNMKIIEEELKVNPTAFGYFNLGTQFKSIGEMDKAVQAFSKSYSLNSDTVFAPKLIIYLVQCLTDLSRYEEALQVLQDSTQLYPFYTDLYYQMGIVYKKCEYWKDAERTFLKCLELGEVSDHLFSSLEGVGSYLAHAHLAEIYIQLNQPELARKYIVKSLTQNKMHLASLRIFLDLFINSNPEDVMKQLQVIYTIESSEEASLLMQALYLFRNPLFVSLSKFISHKLDDELKAWTLQVEGKLESAKELWLTLPEITEGTQRDLLFASMVTEDESYFKSFVDQYNLRSKDKTLLGKLIRREVITKADITPELNEYFSNLCYDLLMLRKYDVIEYLIQAVQVPMLRFELAKMLHRFQFTDLALQAVMEPEKRLDKAEVYNLTGDLLNELKMYGDAYEYYMRSSEITEKFEIIFKIYTLASMVGDESIKRQAMDKMKSRSPLSVWAQQNYG